MAKPDGQNGEVKPEKHTRFKTERTWEPRNADDRWNGVMQAMLKGRWLPAKLFSYKPAKLSVEGLAETLYNPDMGGEEVYLDMKLLVQNDRDAMIQSELEAHQDDRIASIEVFDSDFAWVIDTLMLASVFATMVTAPLTFMWNGTLATPDKIPGGPTLIAFEIAMDVMYGLYLLVSLDMSYLSPTQRMEVVTSKNIVSHHLHSFSYWVKWLSTTTYFWVRVCGLPLWINLIKVVRGGVFISLPDSWWRLQDNGVVRMAQPIILLMIASHWTACLLFCFGGFEEALVNKGPENFATTYRGQEVNGYISLYVVAYVEAIYMLTGALDGPTGDGARDGHFGALILVVIFAPIGQLVVSLFIAAIVQEFTLANALNQRHNENKAFMERAVQILGIPPDLQRRVFSMHYFQKMSHDHEALQILFDGKNLSSSLSGALKIYLYRESVLCSPYLRGKDSNYIVEVVKVLQDEVCLPGEYVARRGEIAHQMFFIARGKLAVLIPDLHTPHEVSKARHVNTMGRSQFFGEVALIKDCVRTAWIRADTYALLSSLSRHDIEPIWKYFPEEREELVSQVAETAAKDKKRAAKNRWLNAMTEKRDKLLALGDEQDEPAMQKRPSRRQSALAGVPEENDDDVLASADSTVLDTEQTEDTQQLLKKVLERQDALEQKFEAQHLQLLQALAQIGSNAETSSDAAPKDRRAEGAQVAAAPKRVKMVKKKTSIVEKFFPPKRESADGSSPISPRSRDDRTPSPSPVKNSRRTAQKKEELTIHRTELFTVQENAAGEEARNEVGGESMFSDGELSPARPTQDDVTNPFLALPDSSSSEVTY
eukprot:TRINITY_DN19670_c0_g1_i2.p1 TRINITY_DN19670_c0_g1~~TRINITY_DN19670_c0_g1_i2.p1  ORF type:complete len:823 (+),score=153.56 TRINITY_DN19670_c0_g1_i2:75-2543(+)